MNATADLITVFRSTALIGVKRAAELLEWNGIPCSIEPENSPTNTPIDDHVGTACALSFGVLVEESFADHARQVLDHKGFETIIESEALSMTPQPADATTSKVLVVTWIISLAALIIIFLYYFMHRSGI